MLLITEGFFFAGWWIFKALWHCPLCHNWVHQCSEKQRVWQGNCHETDSLHHAKQVSGPHSMRQCQQEIEQDSSWGLEGYEERKKNLLTSPNPPFKFQPLFAYTWDFGSPVFQLVTINVFFTYCFSRGESLYNIRKSCGGRKSEELCEVLSVSNKQTEI